MNFISDDDVEGVTISVRDAPPSHYIFKIQSFSSLLKYSIESYDSSEFELGGYKWKLSLYPNGSKKVDGKDHISLYLAMADTSSLPFNWEVNVIFKFFLLDQIRQKYLMIQDIKGRCRRFHGGKTELGFSQLIPHTTFNDPCNGYLVDDTCVFGAEIFVLNSTTKVECLSMIEEAASTTTDECLSMVTEAASTTKDECLSATSRYTLKIENFSQLTKGPYFSEAFSTTDHKWKIKLYPKGTRGEKSHIALFLVMTESTTPNETVYARYSLCIRDQITDKHIERKGHGLFELNNGRGWLKFIPLNDLSDETNGLLVHDTCVLVAEVNTAAD